jgi:XRE family transcriptional regulator of biofilm formation
MVSIIEGVGYMIGEQIKRLRQEKGYSISKLAKLAAVSKTYLSQMERGLQSNPTLQLLNKISATLETNLDRLLEDSKPKKDGAIELDEEWKKLIRQAMAAGLKTEDFQEYRKYISFQTWMKEQK